MPEETPKCYLTYDNNGLRGLPNWCPPWEFITYIDTEPVKSEPKTYSELVKYLLDCGVKDFYQNATPLKIGGNLNELYNSHYEMQLDGSIRDFRDEPFGARREWSI